MKKIYFAIFKKKFLRLFHYLLIYFLFLLMYFFTFCFSYDILIIYLFFFLFSTMEAINYHRWGYLPGMDCASVFHVSALIAIRPETLEKVDSTPNFTV